MMVSLTSRQGDAHRATCALASPLQNGRKSASVGKTGRDRALEPRWRDRCSHSGEQSGASSENEKQKCPTIQKRHCWVCM